MRILIAEVTVVTPITLTQNTIGRRVQPRPNDGSARLRPVPP